MILAMEFSSPGIHILVYMEQADTDKIIRNNYFFKTDFENFRKLIFGTFPQKDIQFFLQKSFDVFLFFLGRLKQPTRGDRRRPLQLEDVPQHVSGTAEQGGPGGHVPSPQ